MEAKTFILCMVYKLESSCEWKQVINVQVSQVVYANPERTVEPVITQDRWFCFPP